MTDSRASKLKDQGQSGTLETALSLLCWREKGKAGGLRDEAGEVGRAKTTWLGPRRDGGICSPSRPFLPLCGEQKQGRESEAKMGSSGGSCGRPGARRPGPTAAGRVDVERRWDSGDKGKIGKVW